MAAIFEVHTTLLALYMQLLSRQLTKTSLELLLLPSIISVYKPNSINGSLSRIKSWQYLTKTKRRTG